jgi:hypothetical protein
MLLFPSEELSTFQRQVHLHPTTLAVSVAPIPPLRSDTMHARRAIESRRATLVNALRLGGVDAAAMPSSKPSAAGDKDGSIVEASLKKRILMWETRRNIH